MGKSKVKVKVTTGSSKGSKLGEQTAVAQNSPNEEKGQKLYAPKAKMTAHIRRS